MQNSAYHFVLRKCNNKWVTFGFWLHSNIAVSLKKAGVRHQPHTHRGSMLVVYSSAKTWTTKRLGVSKTLKAQPGLHFSITIGFIPSGCQICFITMDLPGNHCCVSDPDRCPGLAHALHEGTAGQVPFQESPPCSSSAPGLPALMDQPSPCCHSVPFPAFWLLVQPCINVLKDQGFSIQLMLAVSV